MLDASAVVAMLVKELGYESLLRRVVEQPDVRISPMSYVETVMALARSFADPTALLDAFMQQHSVIVENTDIVQAQWAVKAFVLYGKGRHAARLNLGDCFSYAAAKSLNAPLLYVGGDFSKTDLRTA
jgi:ribonuclease VapC